MAIHHNNMNSVEDTENTGIPYFEMDRYKVFRVHATSTNGCYSFLWVETNAVKGGFSGHKFYVGGGPGETETFRNHPANHPRVSGYSEWKMWHIGWVLRAGCLDAFVEQCARVPRPRHTNDPDHPDCPSVCHRWTDSVIEKLQESIQITERGRLSRPPILESIRASDEAGRFLYSHGATVTDDEKAYRGYGGADKEEEEKLWILLGVFVLAVLLCLVTP